MRLITPARVLYAGRRFIPLTLFCTHMVYCGQQRVDGCADDIGIYACAPVQLTCFVLNPYVCDCSGAGALFQRVLLVGYQLVVHAVMLFQRVAYCIQTAVSGGVITFVLPSKVVVTSAIMPLCCLKCTSVIS